MPQKISWLITAWVGLINENETIVVINYSRIGQRATHRQDITTGGIFHNAAAALSVFEAANKEPKVPIVPSPFPDLAFTQ